MSTPPAHVALVLHAHLPYVRHPEHPRSLEERWLFEALWESYLPLLDVLDRLAGAGVRAPFTLSISPPLAAMLRDPLLGRRFERHLDRTEALGVRAATHLAGGPFAPALAFHRRRLEAARATWSACRGDLIGALRRHAAAGHLELLTTAATHAFLPGLLPTPASIRAQIRLGRRAFGALVHGDPAVAPPGFWLPECAFDPRLDAELAGAGVRFTVLDAHALELGSPRPPEGAAAPIVTPAGVACFARDPVSAREVWSRDRGYPGHPLYREYYRDAGFELPEDVLGDEIGPGGVRLRAGLGLHRVTARGQEKAPYDPDAAAAQARAHADDFVARRREHLGRLPAAGSPPILVAAYDAELFGHWWLEGPSFLEQVLLGLATAVRGGGPSPTTLGAYLDRRAPTRRAMPAASTWGEGGWGAVWIGPRTARLWRHVHHAEGPVRAAIGRARGQGGEAGRAVDQAIRELLLLQASDWAFMIDRGEMSGYAEARVRAHAGRARRLAEMAAGAVPLDPGWLGAVERASPFLAELAGAQLRDVLDAPG